MMRNYPNGQMYESLYARYLSKRPVSKLVDLAGDISGKRVLDLCCGTGRLMEECISRGAEVVGVDESERMTRGFVGPSGQLIVKDVDRYLRDAARVVWPEKRLFDFVFCRQAVNYWMQEGCVHLLSDLMVKGGKFIFNTFNRRPSKVPTVKEYDFDGSRFVEVSWSEGVSVHHVQIREGIPPHVTEFLWISPNEFKRILGKHFDVKVSKDGGTSIYVCTKGK